MPTIGSGRITPGTGDVTFPNSETAAVPGVASDVSSSATVTVATVAGTNLGTGDGIYSSSTYSIDSSGSNHFLRFRSLVAGTNITFQDTNETITINSTGSGGSSAFVQLSDGPEIITPNAILAGSEINNIPKLVWSGTATQAGQVLTWNGSSFVFLQPVSGLTSFSIASGPGISVSGAAPFNTNNGTFTIGLTNSGVTAGTYNSVTVDVTGRVIAATKNTSNQPITLSGDVAGVGTNSILVTLANTGVTAGTYSNISIDTKGRVLTARPISVSDISNAGGAPLNSPVFTDSGNIGVRSVTPVQNDNSTRIATTAWVTQQNYLASPMSFTGDVAGSGGESIALTLATVMSAGTYNSVTVDAKGRVIAGSTTTVANVGTSELTPNYLCGETVAGNTSYNITPNQLVQSMYGTVRNAITLANDPTLTPSTAGVFWNAIDAAAYTAANPGHTGIVNHVTLFQAAVNWSIANQIAVRFPAQTYFLGTGSSGGTTNIQINGTGAHLIFDDGARITWAYTVKAASIINNNGLNTKIEGGTWGPLGDTYVDYLTGQLLQTPSMPSLGPVDASNWRSVWAGNWQGLTILGGMITSSVTLFQKATNVVTFDSFPTWAPSLSALQAAVSASMATTGKPVAVVNSTYLNAGSTIASPSAITASGNGFQITLTPASGQKFAVQSDSPGAVPAILRTPETTGNPALIEREAFAPPMFYFLSGPPVFPTGGFILNYGDGLQLYNITLVNISGARSILSFANRMTIKGFRAGLSDGNSGSAPIRVGGGTDVTVDFDWIYSGDQSLQGTSGATYSNGVIGGNYNIKNLVYRGGRAASLCAQTVAFSTSVGNYDQATVWMSNPADSNPIGNVLTMDLSTLPNGLTVADLEASDASGNSNTIYVYAQQKCIADGSAVVGYTNNGNGTCAITLSPPQGTPNAILKAITTANQIRFLNGVPLGIMTANIENSGIIDCEIISPTGLGFHVTNDDSQGIVEFFARNCTIDSSYCLLPYYQSMTPATNNGLITVSAGSYGGCRTSFTDIIIRNPPSQAVSTIGNVLNMTMRNVISDPPQNQASPLYHWDLRGIQSGTIDAACRTWCGYGQETVRLGGANGSDGLGEVLNGPTENMSISMQFQGAQDGYACIGLYGATNCSLTGMGGYQASPLGSGNASLVSVYSGSSNNRVDGNNLTQFDGQPYIIANGAQPLTIGFYDMYNPSPAGSGVTTPVPTIPASLTAALNVPATQRISSLLAQGTGTVNAFTTSRVWVECSQAGAVSTATITFPAGAFNGQQILLTSASTITTLTINGAATTWTPATLPKYTGITFIWSVYSSQWEQASAPP